MFVLGGWGPDCDQSTSTIWVTQQSGNGTLSAWAAAGTLPAAGSFYHGGAFLLDQSTVLIAIETGSSGVVEFYEGTISGNVISNWMAMGNGPAADLNYTYYAGSVYGLGGGSPQVYRRKFR